MKNGNKYNTGKRRLITALKVAADALICAVLVFPAFLLRFAPDMPSHYFGIMVCWLPLFVVPYVLSFFIFGMYHVLWRYGDIRQIFKQAFAALAGVALIYIVNAIYRPGLSRYMIAIHCGLVILFVCSERMLVRIFWDYNGSRFNIRKEGFERSKRVLIVGAGMGGSYAITLCQKRPAAMGKVVALVDDSPVKQGMRIQNISVAGSVSDIPHIVKRYRITNILIAMPSVRGERMRHIISICNATRCEVMMLSDPERLPDTEDKIDTLTLHKPNIADFLARDEIHLNSWAVEGYLREKTVLVTGGGGSIGSEICRQVMAVKPARLVIFDIYENCAYELECELKQKYGSDCGVEVLIGSVRDRARLDEVMRLVKPDVVFHAAAHKHVPLMEYSPAEAVKNNIFGTINVIEAAAMSGVKRYVQISTDKAVNPTNVMGATKRAAEMIMQYYAHKLGMQCMAVRFGNVLGSHGSVIPLFEQQILSGGPLTITHPDITRYFMTIPEAAQLVLQAGSNADRGCIYVLDMGQPVRIMDLATKLIRFYGLEPEKDIQIKVTGLRPGEKLYEELLMDSEMDQMTHTAHNKIMIAPAISIDEKEFIALLEQMHEMVEDKTGQYSAEDVTNLLKKLVPTFRHAPLGQEGEQTQAKMDDAAAATM